MYCCLPSTSALVALRAEAIHLPQNVFQAAMQPHNSHGWRLRGQPPMLRLCMLFGHALLKNNYFLCFLTLISSSPLSSVLLLLSVRIRIPSFFHLDSPPAAAQQASPFSPATESSSSHAAVPDQYSYTAAVVGGRCSWTASRAPCWKSIRAL